MFSDFKSRGFGIEDTQLHYADRLILVMALYVAVSTGQAVRRCGMRRCRYIGLAKTHLQHLISAAAINLVRIANWVNGIPTAQTR